MCLGEADGLATNAAGMALAILTADCLPILMVSPQHRVVMALHAGWRGTAAGIAARGLELGRTSFGIKPEHWQVALGPSIDACCYEVGADIGSTLTNRWGAMPDAWQPAGRRGQLSLWRANQYILTRHGADPAAIQKVGPCAACHPTHYFSHRQSGGNTGRQVSLIGFRPFS